MPVKERRFSTTERRPSTDEGWATPALEGAVSFEAPPAPPSPPAAGPSSSTAPGPSSSSSDATRKKIDTADLLRRASFAEGVDLSRTGPQPPPPKRTPTRKLGRMLSRRSPSDLGSGGSSPSSMGRGKQESWGVLSGLKKVMKANEKRRNSLQRSVSSGPNRRKWTGASKIEVDLGDTVISVTVSDDETMFAAGGASKKAHVFSTADGRELACFACAQPINSLLFCDIHPRRAYLLAGTFGGIINAFDVSAGRDAGSTKFGGGGDAVHAMAIGAAGTKLAVGGKSKHIIIYNVALAEGGAAVLGALELTEAARVTPMGTVLALAFDSLAEVLAVGGEARVVQVWLVPGARPPPAPGTAAAAGAAGALLPGLDPGQPPLVQFSCASAVHSIALTASGETLAVGTSDLTELYHLHRGDEKGDVSGGYGGAGTSGGGSKLRYEPLLLLEQPAHQGGVSISEGTEENPERKLAVCGNQLCTLTELQSGGTLSRMSRDARLRCVALSRTGALLVVGGFDKKVVLNYVEKGAAINQYIAYFKSSATGDAADAARAACGGSAGAGGAATTVRSVHLSADSARLAIGSDVQGRGRALLYDADTNALLAAWEHDKAVFSVRLSPNGRLLAVAGYGGKMTLYDACTYFQLHEVQYTSMRGPPFIWSTDFSGDSRYLAVGNWNGSSYLYEIDEPALVVKREAELAAAERAVTKIRTPRSEKKDDGGDGTSEPPMARGGSGRVAELAAKALGGSPGARASSSPALAGLVDQLRQGQGRAASAVEEVEVLVREDRVYAVALDEFGAHMVVGGRDKMVAMYRFDQEAPESGMREPMWEATSDDFVYDVALSADLRYCAFGGTGKVVELLDGRSGLPLFEVSCDGTVWSVDLLDDKLLVGGECPTVLLYDVPSQTAELHLPVTEVTYAVSISQDSICYASGNHASLFGKGGAHYSWRDQPSFEVVSAQVLALASSEELLMRCLRHMISRHPAMINAHHPLLGTSLLQLVVQKCAFDEPLELLLNASCRVGLRPDFSGQTALSAALRSGKRQMLQHLLAAAREGRFTLIPGCTSYISDCFELMARRYPLDFLHFIAGVPLQPEPEVLGSDDYFDIVLPSRLVVGSSQRSPKGIWNEKLSKFRHEAEAREHAVYHDGAARRGSIIRGFGGDRLSAARGSEDAGAAGGAGAELSLAEPTMKETSELAIEQGFSKTTRGGLHAARVPFEGFAGGGDGPSCLQLVVNAVGATKEYAVFGSKPMELLLEFKWRGFMRMAFMRELGWFLFNGAVIVWFNFSASSTIHLTRAELLADEWRAHADLLGLWAATTVLMLIYLYGEFVELSSAGSCLDFWTDGWNVIDATIITSQLAVNTLFWIRDEAPDAFSGYDLGFSPSAPPGAPPPPFPPAAGGRRALRAGGGSSSTAGSSAASVEEAMLLDVNARAMRSAMVGASPGAFLTLQSVVVLALTMRLLYFFRGSKKLGALVHTLVEIVIDIQGLVLLLLTIIGGLAIALYILLQHSHYSEWEDLSALFAIINMGLYAEISPSIHSLSHWQVIVIYEIMMMAVQIVLLNLLIAIMSDSHARVAENSLLVAQFERAKMILEHERLMFKKDAPIAPSDAPINPFLDTTDLRRCWDRWLPPLFRQPRQADVFPRWLHLLETVDERRAVGEHAALRAQIDDVRGAVDASAAELRKNFDSQLEKLQQKINDASVSTVAAVDALKERLPPPGSTFAPAAPQGERTSSEGRRSPSPPHPGWNVARRSIRRGSVHGTLMGLIGRGSPGASPQPERRRSSMSPLSSPPPGAPPGGPPPPVAPPPPTTPPPQEALARALESGKRALLGALEA